MRWVELLGILSPLVQAAALGMRLSRKLNAQSPELQGSQGF
jgi:hypothetical protein